jgi:hypothetical protein
MGAFADPTGIDRKRHEQNIKLGLLEQLVSILVVFAFKNFKRAEAIFERRAASSSTMATFGLEETAEMTNLPGIVRRSQKVGQADVSAFRDSRGGGGLCQRVCVVCPIPVLNETLLSL